MRFPWDNLKWVSYPDGTGYFKGEVDKHITFHLNDYSDLWKLNHLHNIAEEGTVVTIPWLIDGQADKKEYNKSQGLKLVLEFLKSLYKFEYRIFHPHNTEVVTNILGDRVEIISNSSLVRKVLDLIKGNESNTVLVSTDAGGFKALAQVCKDLDWKGETFSAVKYRDTEGNVFTEVPKKDFGGKNVLIVDDILIYGGTLNNVAEGISNNGQNVSDIYAVISHCTVTSPMIGTYLKKVFVSDSKRINSEHSKIEVISH